MELAPAVGGVRRTMTTQPGALISDNQHNSVAARFLVRGCNLTDAEFKQGSEKIAKMHLPADNPADGNLFDDSGVRCDAVVSGCFARG